MPRIAALLACLLLSLPLAACDSNGSHMTSVPGALPRLDFHMIRASDGKAVRGADYRGKVVALYFGFTHCPDVCPATLANLSDVARRAGPDFRILFVTVDTARDTRDILREYTQAFSPNMDALYGGRNALADFARNYRVAHGVDPGPPYEVMHTNAVIFFGRDGRSAYVTMDTGDVPAVTRDVRRLLAG